MSTCHLTHCDKQKENCPQNNTLEYTEKTICKPLGILVNYLLTRYPSYCSSQVIVVHLIQRYKDKEAVWSHCEVLSLDHKLQLTRGYSKTNNAIFFT